METQVWMIYLGINWGECLFFLLYFSEKRRRRNNNKIRKMGKQGWNGRLNEEAYLKFKKKMQPLGRKATGGREGNGQVIYIYIIKPSRQSNWRRSIYLSVSIRIVVCRERERELKWGRNQHQQQQHRQWKHSRSWRRQGREHTGRCTEQERKRRGRQLPSRRPVSTRTTKASLPLPSARSPSCVCFPEIPTLSSRPPRPALSFQGFIHSFIYFNNNNSIFFFQIQIQITSQYWFLLCI